MELMIAFDFKPDEELSSCIKEALEKVYGIKAVQMLGVKPSSHAFNKARMQWDASKLVRC